MLHTLYVHVHVVIGDAISYCSKLDSSPFFIEFSWGVTCCACCVKVDSLLLGKPSVSSLEMSAFTRTSLSLEFKGSKLMPLETFCAVEGLLAVLILSALREEWCFFLLVMICSWTCSWGRLSSSSVFVSLCLWPFLLMMPGSFALYFWWFQEVTEKF